MLKDLAFRNFINYEAELEEVKKYPHAFYYLTDL